MIRGLCIGAVAGAIVWLIMYSVCPKPAFVDKILDWFFADRPGPPPNEQRPTRTAMTTLDGNNNGSGGPSRENNNIELQDHRI